MVGLRRLVKENLKKYRVNRKDRIAIAKIQSISKLA